jgi:hypothetical protein
MQRPPRIAPLSLVLMASLLPLPGFAGRPLDTDDAAIIPSGSCQIETFARRVGRGEDMAANRDYGFAPTCNPFGIGEIMIGGNRSGVGQPGSVSEGVVQYKDVPVAISRSHAGWGYVASVAEDFAKGQRGPIARTANLNGISSIAPFDGWQFDGNVGWLHRWLPAMHDRDHLVAGIAAEWSLTQRLAIVAERLGTTGLGHTAQVGMTFVLSPRVTLDAAAGRRVHPDGRAPFMTIGLTWVSKSGVITPE